MPRVDPRHGRLADPFDVSSGDSGTRLRAEVHARTDAVDIVAPATLTVGGAGHASATISQDGTLTVPVARPVGAAWSGSRVDVAGADGGGHGHGGHDGAPVPAYAPATGALKALRTGTAVPRVAVNGMTAERTIAVHRGRARAAGPSGCSRVRGAPGRAAPIGGAGTRTGLPRAPRGQAWSRRCVVHAQR
ncbi:hypothetical protein [Actinacidiphila glaucinigra]|uniref:hypothetical protein n=1 Tax=Actinacidiphila glaucinigra TaxID=235986 RepID=UPI002E352119|nr:hypothetical protein [Actinacidiphila glaucinigra]